MLKAIQEFFSSRIEPALGEEDRTRSAHALELATAALLLEVTRADDRLEDSERVSVERAIRESFDLSEEETQEILRLAQEEIDRSISLYEFTHLIDRRLGPDEKRHVVELLWRVAFSDGKADPHEEHLIRKIAKLLHVHHREFIDAKIRARNSRSIS